MNMTTLNTPIQNTASEFEEVQEVLRPKNQLNRKSVYSATELLEMGIVEVPKLWAPFFPTTGVVGLTGSSDCGKSMIVRQMAMAIAMGQKDFLGYPLNTRFGSALYVCTEDDVEGIAALINRQAGTLEPERLSNLHFIFESKDLKNQINGFLSSTKVDFVVLDVWSDTFIGNPNNWVDVRQNIIELSELAKKHDCLFVILHHTVKNSEKHAPDKAKLNGSQAIEARLRCLLELRNGDADNERILYVLKANYMSREEKAQGILLELQPESLTLKNTNKKVSKNPTTKNSDGSKFDLPLWIGRMKPLRDKGLSYDAIKEMLEKEYQGEEVPSKGWIIYNKQHLE